MAIDTADKRRSVAGIPLGLGVTPNASKDAEWRQQVAWGYSGIAIVAASVINGILSLTELVWTVTEMAALSWTKTALGGTTTWTKTELDNDTWTN